MNIAIEVKKLIDIFEANHPELKGKAYLTSGNRTWQEQLDIILASTHKTNYPNIKRDFKTKFGYPELPKSRAELNATELQWWEREIMLQAGVSPGFPHVGGMAQDVSVKNLSLQGRKILKAELHKHFGILLEKISDAKSIYGVDITEANLFHLYRRRE